MMYSDFGEFDGFDWDAGNSVKSLLKHGILPSESEAVFMNEPLVVPDLEHSRFEKRFEAWGVTDVGKRLIVIFTIRERHGQRLIRPISSRRMSRKESHYYEKTLAQIVIG